MFSHEANHINRCRGGSALIGSILTIIIALTLAGAINAEARDLRGISFPDQVTVAGKELQLVGMAAKTHFLIGTVYVAGLYMERPLKSARAVINAEQVKHVVFQLDTRFLTIERFIEHTDRSFRDNNPPSLLVRIRPRIDQYYSMWSGRPKRGDRLSLTYIPGKGTVVRFWGKKRGVIPGADFMRALFAIWLGENPPQPGFRQAFLGRK